MSHRPFNGYSKYSTWLIHDYLMNNVKVQSEVFRVVKQEDMDDFGKAEEVKFLIKEILKSIELIDNSERGYPGITVRLFENGLTGDVALVKDLVNAALKDVEWEEIVESYSKSVNS